MGKSLDSRLAFRVPKEVAEAWKRAAAASGLSLSDWIRQQVGTPEASAPVTGKGDPCAGRRRSQRPWHPAEARIAHQVARIGNNLNQVARVLNSGGKIPQASLLAVMIAVEGRLHELLDRCI